MKPYLGLVVILLAGMTLGGAVCAEEAQESEGAIAISEILFNPAGPEIDGEFVELRNIGVHGVNINNWTLSDQDGKPEIVFPNITVAPGELIVVYTGSGENRTLASPYTFHLWASYPVWNNPGDDVLLTDGDGTVAAYLSYGNGSAVDPCPEEGDWQHVPSLPPEGYALALQEKTGLWRACVPSPGHPNPPAYSTGTVLVTEVCYNPKGGSEYVRLANPGPEQIDLTDWALSDREGVLVFPRGTTLAQGCTIYVAENATLFNLTFGREPDIEWKDMYVLDAGFKLANQGDEVLLLDPWGVVIDACVYGSSTYEGAGWIGEPAELLAAGKVSVRVQSKGSYLDTDTANDWDKEREYVPGQTTIAPMLFRSANLTFYAFPDAGYEAVERLIQSAKSAIALNLYHLSSYAVARVLASKAGEGITVRIIIEGSPVGGLSSASLECLDIIGEKGGDVRLMLDSPYNFNHAKYMIIDRSMLFISTENWGANGLPPKGASGNRGWAVSVRDGGLSAYFLQVFENDWNTSTPWKDARYQVKVHSQESSDAAGRAVCRFPPMNASSEARITPVLAPDSALSEDTVLGMIRGARQSVLVEQFYIHRYWAKRVYGSKMVKDNPFVSALVSAARRGCEVRVLLDATWYNTDPFDENDNDDTVRYLNTLSALEGLKIHAKLVRMESHDFVKIHAKGVIVDGTSVLISSINWNRNSVVENRETGLLVESSEAAEYFTRVFEHDWTDDFSPPRAVLSIQGEALVGSTLTFSAEGSEDDVGITNYKWWVDGMPASSGAPLLTWTFASPGTHDVRLNVSDAWGNSNATSAVIEVSEVSMPEIPTASFEDSNEEYSQNTDDIPEGDGWIYMTLLALPGALVSLCWLFSKRHSKGAKPHPFIRRGISARDAHRSADEGQMPAQEVQHRVHQVLSKGEDGRRDHSHGG